MKKIIEINNKKIFIGGGDGSLIEVQLSDLNFVPRVGDIVDVYQSEQSIKVIISMENINSYKQSAQKEAININNNKDLGYKYVTMTRGKVVNKVIYLIICIFFGLLGVHKFYAGRVGLGILYLLTFGLFGFGIVVDFIIGICKPSDTDGNMIV